MIPVETPTTQDVAALLRTRTKDLNGTEVGEFTADTRPTTDEATAAIAQAYAEVTGRIGFEIAERWRDAARALIAIRAAMWIELSYFPEQVRSDRSVYQELAQQYANGATALDATLSDNDPGAGGSARFGSIGVMGATAAAAAFELENDPDAYVP
jgi:hypothetical protein